jgi:hypothetical protein
MTRIRLDKAHGGLRAIPQFAIWAAPLHGAAFFAQRCVAPEPVVEGEIPGRVVAEPGGLPLPHTFLRQGTRASLFPPP